MAKNITLEILSEQIASLATTVESGFAAVANDIADLRHELKGDIATVRTQVNSIERELRDIKLSLTRVAYREDIDEALKRIAAIEQHLGLNQKIAA